MVVEVLGLKNVCLQVDDSMQRLLAKERASQTRALDLQSQLSRAQTELSQVQRSKEEVGSSSQHRSSLVSSQVSVTDAISTRDHVVISSLDGAPVSQSAAEHEGEAGAVGLYKPQSAELCSVSQNVIWKRVWRLFDCKLTEIHQSIDKK